MDVTGTVSGYDKTDMAQSCIDGGLQTRRVE